MQSLIPDNYVDIHSHLLPAIDDGAKTFEDTASLIRALQKIGFSQFITTPHIMKNIWENSKAGIEDKLSDTKKELGEINLDVPLKAASEYMLDANFVELFQSEPLLTLKDNYVLVEMSYINPPLQLYNIIFELQLAGYIPVLAHPERYAFYHTNFGEYEKLKNSGCYFQLNLLSVVGYYGIPVMKTAEKLLKSGMVNFTGSDVHHQNHINSFRKKVGIGAKEVALLKQAIANNQFFRF